MIISLCVENVRLCCDVKVMVYNLSMVYNIMYFRIVSIVLLNIVKDNKFVVNDCFFYGYMSS